MPRGWPPLKRREVIDILLALGLAYDRSTGGHDYYKGVRNGQQCTVTVDAGRSEFDYYLRRFMCNQARASRKEFYGATPQTAKKIS